MADLIKATKKIHSFQHDNLTNHLANLEAEFEGVNQSSVQVLCSSQGIDDTLFSSAIILKNAVGQIDVIIHAVGILLSLPHILKKGEIIESLSLGAGNTGKQFDLETNLRIAEFKFIQWKGGSESIRQNSIFKDFYCLAECNTKKRRYLYVRGLEHPLRFLNGDRAIDSVLSRNNKLFRDFRIRFGNRFQRVSEYYNYRKEYVEIVDMNDIMPSLNRDRREY